MICHMTSNENEFRMMVSEGRNQILLLATLRVESFSVFYERLQTSNPGYMNMHSPLERGYYNIAML